MRVVTNEFRTLAAGQVLWGDLLGAGWGVTSPTLSRPRLAVPDEMGVFLHADNDDILYGAGRIEQNPKELVTGIGAGLANGLRMRRSPAIVPGS